MVFQKLGRIASCRGMYRISHIEKKAQKVRENEFSDLADRIELKLGIYLHISVSVPCSFFLKILTKI